MPQNPNEKKPQAPISGEDALTDAFASSDPLSAADYRSSQPLRGDSQRVQMREHESGTVLSVQRPGVPVQPQTQSMGEDGRFQGAVVDGYRLVREIAVGGMGFIYRAEKLEDPSQVLAVKILHPDLAQHDILVQRFLREARVMKKLSHPRIVGLQMSGQNSELGLYMGLEWLEGKSLKEKYREHRNLFEQEQIFHWVEQLGHALQFAHQKGVVHRDVKPDNVFLLDKMEDSISKKGRMEKSLRLIDFGIATADDEPFIPGERVGTPRYMAPEQILNQPVTPRTDIYAFGHMIFEMLTRRPVFHMRTSEELKRAHLYLEPPTLSQVRPDLLFPTELEEIMQQLMAKNPEERPSSIPDFFQLLAPILLTEKIQRRKGKLGIVIGKKKEEEAEGGTSSNPVLGQRPSMMPPARPGLQPGAHTPPPGFQQPLPGIHGLPGLPGPPQGPAPNPFLRPTPGAAMQLQELGDSSLAASTMVFRTPDFKGNPFESEEKAGVAELDALLDESASVDLAGEEFDEEDPTPLSGGAVGLLIGVVGILAIAMMVAFWWFFLAE